MDLGTPVFSSAEAYRGYCNGLIETFAGHNGDVVDTHRFQQHLATIERGGEQVIKTSWGGVDIQKYEHPSVEKFLVVQQGKFLAFEKHDEKVETLMGKEGYGVLVYRPEGEQELRAEAIVPGWSRTLQPGQEHTIVALTDLLVLEHSDDPKGMDKDLIFMYMPDPG
jgi:hypothetical protein